MKKLVTALLSTLAFTAFGCVDGNTAFRVTGNLEVTGDCEPSPTSTSYVALAYWDLAGGSINGTYIFDAQVISDFIDRSTELSNNVHDIIVEGWEVELRNADGDRLVLNGVENPYRVVEGGNFTVPTGGQVAKSLTLIPQSYRVPLQDVVPAGPNSVIPIYAHFRLYGETVGGLSTETPWVNYPITLCIGCLATTCDPGETVPDGVCRPGQNLEPYCS